MAYLVGLPGVIQPVTEVIPRHAATTKDDSASVDGDTVDGMSPPNAQGESE